jgi:uncharacterized RDD family membrane protein YckC
MINVEELKQDERRFWGAESHVDERLADNGPRVVGAAIDQGIVLAGSVIVLGFGFGVHGFARVVVAALLAFAYFTVAIGHWGQTAGARIMSVRVTRARHDDTPPGFTAAAIRAAVPALPAMLLTHGGVLSVLSVLALCLVYAGLFRNRQRQGLHDKAAGTIVVHVPPEA